MMAEGRAGDATRSNRKIWMVRWRSSVAGLRGGGGSSNNVKESGSEGKHKLATLVGDHGGGTIC
ncbi:hypothetical protein OROMI_031415 [Orobanche minor]